MSVLDEFKAALRALFALRPASSDAAADGWAAALAQQVVLRVGKDGDDTKLVGVVDLAEGNNVTITRQGNKLVIASSGGAGGTPSDTVVAATGFGQGAAPGLASTFARGDHTHGTPALGNTGTTACAGNDPRLSDARIPTAHAASHISGSDLLADMVGDSGSGGAHGLVPAPAAGDAAAHKVLGAGGGFVALSAADVGADPSGAAATVQTHLDAHTGDADNPHGTTAVQVGAPALVTPSTNGHFVAFNGVSGAQKDSGYSASSFDAAGAAAGAVSAHAGLTSGVHGAGSGAVEVTMHKGAAYGYASLDGSSKVVQDPASASSTPAAGRIVVADALGRVDPWLTDRGWHGVLYAAEGDCDPHRMLREWNTTCSVAGPTPSAIGPISARCVKFVPPRAMTVARVHLFGIGVTSGIYKFAIYPSAPGAAKLWDSNVVTSAANAWLSISYGLPVSLLAGTEYWFCVAVTTTGGTPAFRSRGAPPGPVFWGPESYPLGGRGLLFPEYGQFAVSGGVFPSNLPSVGSATYGGGVNGSVPYALLDSAAS